MSDLSNPNAWEDGNENTPPDAFSAAKGLFVIDGTLTLDRARFFYLNDPAQSFTFHWEITTANGGDDLRFEYNSTTGVKQVVLGTALASGQFTISDLDQTDFWWRITDNVDFTAPNGPGVVEIGDQVFAFNCECDEDEVETDTLSNLRTRLARRLGYSAQATNLPPGMSELLDEFLQDAQKILYKRFPALRTERIYKWLMTPGVRFYGIRDNDDACAKKLDPYMVSWVGVEDTNRSWYELREGIMPEFYTSVMNRGWPTHYEIRQCIEVFPAPDQAYILRVKGRFGLLAFSDDADKTTLPANPVFHFALGMAKRHYKKPDAQEYFDIAITEIGDYISGSHGTRRYVPHARQSTLPMPKPTMKGGFDA